MSELKSEIPLPIRRAVVAFWVAGVCFVLQNSVNATVTLPAGTSKSVSTGIWFVLILIVYGAEFCVIHLIARGLCRRRRWAKWLVTTLMVLSIAMGASWLTAKAITGFSAVVIIGFLALNAYTLAQLYGRVGKAWFAHTVAVTGEAP